MIAVNIKKEEKKQEKSTEQPEKMPYGSMRLPFRNVPGENLRITYGMGREGVIQCAREDRQKVAKPMTTGYEMEFGGARLLKEIKNGVILAFSGKEKFPLIKLESEGARRGVPALELISGPLAANQETGFWEAVRSFKQAIGGGGVITVKELIRRYKAALPKGSAFRMTVNSEEENTKIAPNSNVQIQRNIAVNYNSIGTPGMLAEFFTNPSEPGRRGSGEFAVLEEKRAAAEKLWTARAKPDAGISKAAEEVGSGSAEEVRQALLYAYAYQKELERQEQELKRQAQELERSLEECRISLWHLEEKQKEITFSAFSREMDKIKEEKESFAKQCLLQRRKEALKHRQVSQLHAAVLEISVRIFWLYGQLSEDSASGLAEVLRKQADLQSPQSEREPADEEDPDLWITSMVMAEEPEDLRIQEEARKSARRMVARQEKQMTSYNKLRKKVRADPNNTPAEHKRFLNEAGEQLWHLQFSELVGGAVKPALPKKIAGASMTPAVKSLFTHMLFELQIALNSLPSPEGGSKLSDAKLRFKTLIKTSAADALFYVLTPEERRDVRALVGYEPGGIDREIETGLLNSCRKASGMKEEASYAVGIAMTALRQNLLLLEQAGGDERPVYGRLFQNAPRREAIIAPYTDMGEKNSYVVVELRTNDLNQEVRDRYDRLTSTSSRVIGRMSGAFGTQRTVRTTTPEISRKLSTKGKGSPPPRPVMTLGFSKPLGALKEAVELTGAADSVSVQKKPPLPETKPDPEKPHEREAVPGPEKPHEREVVPELEKPDEPKNVSTSGNPIPDTQELDSFETDMRKLINAGLGVMSGLNMQQRIAAYESDPRITWNNPLIDTIAQAQRISPSRRQLAQIRVLAGRPVGLHFIPGVLPLNCIRMVLGISQHIAVIGSGGGVIATGQSGAVIAVEERQGAEGLEYRLLQNNSAVPFQWRGEAAAGIEGLRNMEMPVDVRTDIGAAVEYLQGHSAIHVNNCLINAIAGTMDIAPESITEEQIARIRILAGAAAGDMLNFDPRTVNAILDVLSIPRYTVVAEDEWGEDRVTGQDLSKTIYIKHGAVHFTKGSLR